MILTLRSLLCTNAVHDEEASAKAAAASADSGAPTISVIHCIRGHRPSGSRSCFGHSKEQRWIDTAYLFACSNEWIDIRTNIDVLLAFLHMEYR
ncbi:hypothetical protein OIU85_013298 [Salix viminalis]|uniref:Uncharacterized protein n=1 Tax=Salix viminalis TaxID=40686 RepID=A0A9Q0SCI5_SALVM|nr:hypothetical protein OIU85_013298 [Salix viminalis]